MDRRDFIKTFLLGAAGVVAAGAGVKGKEVQNIDNREFLELRASQGSLLAMDALGIDTSILPDLKKAACNHVSELETMQALQELYVMML